MKNYFKVIPYCFSRLLPICRNIKMPLFAVLYLISVLWLQGSVAAKQNEKKSQKKTKQYSIEETTRLLCSSKLGNIKLDHDDHVYKCMKISNEGKDLEGAIAAIIEFKMDLGDTLDEDEVTAIIRASKVDTGLLKQTAIDGREIGKKVYAIEEISNILDIMENNMGMYLRSGINLAEECNYRLENSYFTREKMELLANIGKTKDKKRFVKIYLAMKNAGMDSRIYTTALETLYKISLLNGDVADMISHYLKENEWKSRKQPGSREFTMIRDLMNLDYSSYYNRKKNTSTPPVN